MLTDEVKKSFDATIEIAQELYTYKWKAYEYCKKSLNKNLSPEEYGELIKYIADKLGI